jgi:KUP system potassium uptake protein
LRSAQSEPISSPAAADLRGSLQTSIHGIRPRAACPERCRSDERFPSSGHSPNGFLTSRKAGFLALTLGSIGVVYGDIGTSPLYAFREALLAVGATESALARDDVIGLASLILWALMIVVTLKYVLILLNADNNGEGGTLSLLALAQRALERPSLVVLSIGAVGAALFYGDAILTQAISVLSAVEGLGLVTSRLESVVLPATIAIIVALFLVQSRGTAKVASWFGPITLVWFAVMAAGGIVHIAGNPGVLAAVNPLYGIGFLSAHGTVGVIVLGAVFLAVTGAEALYADLGHFGRRPIQAAWLVVVLPSLALNYIGQAALVLAEPGAIGNPFFLLYPEWMLVPIVVIATMATIIASQAVITGAYSLTRQAIQLNLLPRLAVHHTSESTAGQIYMPQINILLLIGVLLLVFLFGSSSKLATAYGIAVTGTMVATVALAFVVVWKHWHWPVWAAALLMFPFLVVDTVFLGANLVKVAHGGYIPLLVGGGILVAIATWVRGTRILQAKSRKDDLPLADLISMLGRSAPTTVPGTAIFLTSDPETTPRAAPPQPQALQGAAREGRVPDRAGR